MHAMTLTLESPTDAAVVLDGVDWETYVRLSDSDRAGLRITYDRGRMEIMPPPSMGHGKRTFLLARLVERYMEAAGVEYVGADVITLRREELLRGCEGDQMYFVRATPPPPEAEQWDAAIHEAPDLVIEVDMTSRSINKEPIYAALGVAEILRLDGDVLRLRVLDNAGENYDDADESSLLPGLPVAELAGHVAMASRVRQPDILRAWRQVLGAGKTHSS